MNTTPSSNQKTEPPNDHNRRKHARVDISNLISVVSIDTNGDQISQCMGRALNVSQSGLKIETPHPLQPFDSGRLSLVTVDTKDKLVKTSGIMVYSTKADSGMYTTGIQLSGMERVKKRFVVSLIKKFNVNKHASQVVVAA